MTAAPTVRGSSRASKQANSPARCPSDQAAAIRRCHCVFALSRSAEETTGSVSPERERATARPRRASGGQGGSGARCASPLVRSRPSGVQPRKRWMNGPPSACTTIQSPGWRAAASTGSVNTSSLGRRVGIMLSPRTRKRKGPDHEPVNISTQGKSRLAMSQLYHNAVGAIRKLWPVSDRSPDGHGQRPARARRLYCRSMSGRYTRASTTTCAIPDVPFDAVAVITSRTG